MTRVVVFGAWIAAVSLLANCATGGDADDAGMETSPTSDVPPTDTTVRDVVDANDAPRDVPVDLATDVHDAADVPIGPVDTGPMFCPDTCSTNAQCQSACPPPATGYHYCCQGGTGGGSCSQQVSTCPPDVPDAGAGSLGATCSADPDCNHAPADCCLAGICGCTMFGSCVPPMFCP